ncbi:glycosyltransferase family 4 protein [Celeribacter halophilus]|jgi:UDP-N-acetylmuramyl pentapeptide phosphotransferase/UDP-N-acetylglucosamine-1-phosphate transferase|uniref:glycosyltransferase family 4 protein n=1 Tax=Celeribacter halophilus TaxID=576117 RepID=UPI001C07F7A0|nr:MraY family glycosyltransferase [Celeribacter halophilus]MBU2888872.1 undecaprenyl/decaprenyl-phosphate alpha-N-acetylglucosaminyl 1-phosphate transferase [Celeribacter halophilus]MDO6511990.1 MraY family glycosyltransferase [Celeribacter halophilus]
MSEYVCSGIMFEAWAASFVVCIGILFIKKFHLKFVDKRGDTAAIQAAHSRPTPRLGGVAILTGIMFLSFLNLMEDAPNIWRLFVPLTPMFIAGIGEDLGFNISPKIRLIAAVISSLIGVYLMGVWIPRSDIPGLDALFLFSPFAIFLTVIATTGVCNAFNLVDGVNGLASMISISVAASLMLISFWTDQTDILTFSLIVVGALLGFLVFNFPHGSIFMGDAGAYGIGYLLVWLGIIMLNRIPEFTPWALLLIFFWPVADTILAIVRRRRAGKPTDQPDRLHFHQLVMRSLEIGMLGRGARHISNPLSTLILLPMFLAPPAIGVLYWDNPLVAGSALAFFSLLFVVTYFMGVRLARNLRSNIFTKLVKKISRGHFLRRHRHS